MCSSLGFAEMIASRFNQYSEPAGKVSEFAPRAGQVVGSPGLAIIGFGVAFMSVPILSVALSQLRVVNDQQVLSVILLGGLGKIEGAGQDKVAVKDHDFVVSNGVGGVD